MGDYATLLGQDIVGPATAFPLGTRPVVDGVPYYDTTNRRWFIGNNQYRPGLLFPADNNPFLSASAPRFCVDDCRTAINTNVWDLNKGTDPQCVNAALYTSGQTYPDFYRMTTGDAGTGMAADGVSMAFKTLTIEAEEGIDTGVMRFKVSAITNVWFFLGFTDVLPSTTLEAPFTLSTTTYTSNATDACGIMFDTAATTDTIRIVGVANDVDATHIDTGVAPVADTWMLVEFSLSLTGVLTVKINGTAYSALSGAVRPGIDLCMIASACTRTTATRDFDLDFATYF